MSYEITSTSIFDKWLKGLKDRTTRNKVLARIDVEKARQMLQELE